MNEAAAERVTFGAVLRVVEFRALWAAEAQSMAGDQLARVALSILVFDRTGSPSLSALVYALTFLPAIVGAALLAGLADRMPRRSLMIGCDLIRAALLAAMAWHATPLPVVCVLLVVSVLVGQPFTAAQVAILPDILDGEAYVVGSGLRMATDQVCQLVGFAGGGIAIAVIGARAGLAVDAVTFAVSALLIWLFVQPRPAAAVDTPSTARAWSTVRRQIHTAGAVVLGNPRLRVLLGLGWLAGLHVVPEGVAVPYANDLGLGPVAVGVLIAALPAGSAVGALLLVRIPAAWRMRLIGPMAVAAAIPMLACATEPNLGISIGLWALTGLFAAYQMPAAAAFVRAVPDRSRGQVIGLVASGLVAIQGLGIVSFGVVAGHVGAARAVALAGGSALALAALLAAGWARVSRSDPGQPDAVDASAAQSTAPSDAT
jgi:predicted MFS family arabinose efflux permease